MQLISESERGDGTIIKTFKDGDHSYREYFRNGFLELSCRSFGGFSDGDHVVYRETGHKYVRVFDMGKLISGKRFDENGELETEDTIEDGKMLVSRVKLNGTITSYYTTGKIEDEYEDGSYFCEENKTEYKKDAGGNMLYEIEVREDGNSYRRDNGGEWSNIGIKRRPFYDETVDVIEISVLCDNMNRLRRDETWKRSITPV